ncbi:MAG: Fe(2+)-trafficking protein [Myxococcales bacterium]|nr:Fe(2+)-trafficking protein [Myxococcales bacterium]USN50776.1 MAG: Fe(2+)-trafficking protein [Myxococcales bacterium]
MVVCKKLARELKGLEQAPLEGPLGQLIKEHISEEAWLDWVEAEMKIINEERLDLSEERSQMRLFEEMIGFLNLQDVIASPE